jgi:molybdopterin synthase sulfur carrier subunit
MAVTLLYLAWVRERVGIAQEQLDALPPDVLSAADLARWLAKRGPGYADAFVDHARLRCAVDQTMVALDAPLGRAREIAFFPPVTGG